MGVREYLNTPRIYFDFDGVLFDFVKQANADGLTMTQAKLEPGMFRRLPVIKGARAFMLDAIQQGYVVFGLTKIPSKNPGAASEKLLAAREHYPELGDHIIISPDKGAVGASKDILIDDMPIWANAHNFPGRVVKFEGCWESIREQLNIPYTVASAKCALADVLAYHGLALPNEVEAVIAAAKQDGERAARERLSSSCRAELTKYRQQLSDADKALVDELIDAMLTSAEQWMR